MVGGMDRLGHKIRQLRDECKKEGENCIVADAGDVFQGSILYSHYKGEVEVNLLNKIKYDVFALGNHEFDDSAINVAKQFSKAKFDVLNCNMNFKPVKALEKIVKPSVVKDFGKEKVAFVGAITPEMELLSGGLNGCKLKAKGKDWVIPIRKEVKRLTDKGINKIVLVTHCGVNEDKELAEAIPEIDAIIGGHSHTQLNKRIIINHKNGASTTIVQTGSYGHNVGRLKLAFDNDGVVNVKKSKYKLFAINQKTKSDKDIANYVAAKVKPYLHLRKEVVGFIANDFGSKIQRSDSAIGNLICDALMELGSEYGVEICMHNRGGIRGHLDKGPLTREALEQVLPFDNYAVFSELQGKDIISALEHSVGGAIGGKFMDIAGLKVAYDPSKPQGKRLVFVLKQNKKGKWVKLNPNKWYKFAINSYNFGGGEGFNFKNARNVKQTKVRMADVLGKYLAKHKKIAPQKPNRLVSIQTGLLKKNKSNQVTLSGVSPNANLSLVLGKEPGVSTIYNAFPVPLNGANISQKLKASKDGSYFWSSPKKLIGEGKLSIKNVDRSQMWLCVVAFPKKKDSGERTMISNPISLKRLSQ